MTESNTQTSIEGTVAANEVPVTGPSHEVALYAEEIGHIGPLPVTNALLTGWSVVVVILVVSIVLKRNLREVPSGLQNVVEMILTGALDLCDQVTGSRKISNKVFPWALSVFIFVLINNWFGLLPLGGVGVVETTKIGSAFIPFLRGGTADLNTTVAVAILSVVGANIFGVFSIGIWKVFNKYFNIRALGEIFTKTRKEPTILIVAPVYFFIGILEFIGEFAKIASLAFRLFGNIFAGEVLLMAMGAILPFVLPIPFIFLEIFVGAIQALIFAILTLVYFTVAAQDHEAEEEEVEVELAGSH